RTAMNQSPLLILMLALTAGLTACGGGSDSDNSRSSSSSSAQASSSLSSSSQSSSSLASSSASSAATTPDAIALSLIGRYSADVFGVSAAEIPAFDPVSKRAFVVTAQLGAVDGLDMVDRDAPHKVHTIDATAIAAGAVVNSVAVQRESIALAIEAASKTDKGYVGFYRTSDLSLISQVRVGALPDMLIFTPDGSKVLVANEGEPSDDYQIDPEGSVSIIDISNIDAPVVTTANFHSFNGQEAALREQG